MSSYLKLKGYLKLKHIKYFGKFEKKISVAAV